MMILGGQWPEPLTKCRSRKSEAASPIVPAPNATLRSLDLAGPRRGLARCITRIKRAVLARDSDP